MNLKAIASKLRQIVCLALIAVAVCSGLVIFSPSAIAAGSQEAANVVQKRAERELDRKAGAGTANQLKGEVEENVGRVQRQFDTNEAEGIAKQARGKARKEVGRAQEAAQDTAESAQDTAEGLVDQVKDFFGQ